MNTLQKADLNKIIRNLSIKEVIKTNWKPYMKINKTAAKFDDTDIEKYNFHQHKSHISINNIDINKKAVSNKVKFCKIDLKYFFCYKELKSLDFYVYFFQKWVDVEEILMKRNICFSLKYIMRFWEESAISSKKNLIVNPYRLKKYLKTLKFKI